MISIWVVNDCLVIILHDCILYADDVNLLSSIFRKLCAYMLDICTQYDNDYRLLMFDNLKFYAVAFDKYVRSIDNLVTLTISTKPITWFE